MQKKSYNSGGGRSGAGKSFGKSDSNFRKPKPETRERRESGADDRSSSEDRPKRKFDKPKFGDRTSRPDSRPDRKYDKPAESRSSSEDRPKRTYDKPKFGDRNDRPDARPDRKFDRSDHNSSSEDRPKRTYDKPKFGDRNDRPDARPDRKFDRSDRSSSSEDRPKRTYDKPKFGDRNDRPDARPDRKFDRTDRSSSSEDRPKRTYDKPKFGDRNDRPDARPDRKFDRSDRNSSSEDRPKRTYNKPKSEDNTERSEPGSDRKFERTDRRKPADDRPKRSYDKPRFGEKADRGEGNSERKFSRSKPKDDRPFRERNKSSFDKRDSDNRDRVQNIETVLVPKPEPAPMLDEHGEPIPVDPSTIKNRQVIKRKEAVTLIKNKKGKVDSDDDEDVVKNPEAMPLNKYIAHSGECSRRDAAELVKQGKVKVNGELVIDPGYKVQDEDKVTLSGKKLTPQKGNVYILLNKPRGFITTNDDPQGRKTVMDLVANSGAVRLYPVGRLDKETTGLLLITNDGELTQKLSHPSYEIKKVYQVTLDRPLTKDDFDKIIEGVELEDGKAIVDEMAYLENKNELGLEIHSGKNRIVRRIFESLKYEVVKLDRVMYAGLTKKNLPRSKWRFLDEKEIVLLKHFKN